MRTRGVLLGLSLGLVVGSAAYGQTPAQEKTAPAAPADICLTNACSTPGRPLVGPGARVTIDRAISAGNAVDVAQAGGSEADIVAALRQHVVTHPGAAAFVDQIDAGGKVTVETSRDGEPTVVIRGADGGSVFAVTRRGPH